MKFVAFVAVVAVAAIAAPVVNPVKEALKIKAVHRMGSEVLTPHQLPCSYAIKMACAVSPAGSNDTTLSEQDFYVDGEVQIFADYYTIESSKFYMQDVIRMDQPFDQLGSNTMYVPRYGSQTGNACGSNPELQDEAREEISSLLGIFNDKQVYQSVTETIFKGKKCRMYYSHNDDSEVRMYVDDDDYIIGTQSVTSDYNVLMAISYNFSITTDVFAMDRSAFPDCDAKAYVPPQEQCPSH